MDPPLSSYLPSTLKPWLEQVRGSLQQSPVYMGKTPRELVLEGPIPSVDEFEIPIVLKEAGEKRINEIYASHIGLDIESVVIEGWPTYSQTNGQR
jgi:hypothetical protein